MSKRATQHSFAISPQNQVPRSSFKRSHTVKTTLDAGRLVPFYIDEVYPGDTFNCKATLFGRMATPIVPAMDNAYMDTFFFSFHIACFGSTGKSSMVKTRLLAIRAQNMKYLR